MFLYWYGFDFRIYFFFISEEWVDFNEEEIFEEVMSKDEVGIERVLFL